MRGFGKGAAKQPKEKQPKEKRPVGERLRGMFGRRFAAGSYSAFAAAAVIAIAVVVNLIDSALPAGTTQIDLTGQSIYTLSDQTKRIMASLNSDVTLYLLAQSGREDEKVTRLLERYEDLSDHIRVSFVDPTQKPTFLDSYELDISRLYANSVLVECGEKNRLVGYDEIFVTSYDMDYYTYNYQTTTSFDGENALTNAIHYVSSGEIPRVYALSGHGETELSGTMETLIERDNLELESLSLLSMDGVPEDASAVVIHVPQSDLSAEEADRLIAYLDAGGRVVLITDYIAPESMGNLMRVAEHMGMKAGEGLIVEGDRNRHIARYPYYLLPEIESHEITQPLSEGGYFVLTPLTQPIEETETGEATVTPLLKTSETAYSKAAALDMQTTEKEDGDADGPFTVAAASERGEARMVWVTSAELLTDSVNAMVSGANSDLFMNSLDWMCDQAETISIRAKSLDEEGLTLTQAQSSFWSVVMIGVIPGALLLAGMVIVVRRKRR